MTRRKTRTFETIHIHVLISFGDVKAGDIAHVERTPRVQGWIDAGLVEVLDDGIRAAAQRVVEEARTLRPVVPPSWVAELKESFRGESETGQGAAEPDDHERVPGGTEGSVSASGEQGESFGAGPYGAPA